MIDTGQAAQAHATKRLPAAHQGLFGAAQCKGHGARSCFLGEWVRAEVPNPPAHLLPCTSCACNGTFMNAETVSTFA